MSGAERRGSKIAKKLRIGIIVTMVLGLLNAGCGATDVQKTGPGNDMEAITEHLSRYSNDPEEHAKTEDLAVIYDYPDFLKMEPWYAFVEKVHAEEPAYVDIVNYTTEGDSIFYYVYYDGKEFLVVQDNTRDQFGSPVVLKEKYKNLYEFTEEAEKGGTIYTVVLSDVELTSLEHTYEVFWQVHAEWEAGEYDPDTSEYERFPCTLIRVGLE